MKKKIKDLFKKAYNRLFRKKTRRTILKLGDKDLVYRCNKG